jgi:hypothetical protein
LNKLSKLVVTGSLLLFVLVEPASAHNVWCHCPKANKLTTLKFFYKAGEVYEALSDATKTWHTANSPLEKGVLAEFDRAVHGTPLKPFHYRETQHALNLLNLKLEVLQLKLSELREIAAEGETTPEFEGALNKMLATNQNTCRLSSSGVRYADVAGKESASAPIKGIVGILDAQSSDLKILRGVLDQVNAGLRDALPLAEKGEFAKVMLSGRNAFGDKMPQLTDMISCYERMYVQTCMSTISATMQVYPKGFEWLK